MANELYREMCAYVDTKQDFIVKTRQDFHKYAEAGWHEVRTCSIIADHLVKLGYTELIMGKDAFKADARMGLPPQEELDEVYQRALDEGAVMPYAELFKDGFVWSRKNSNRFSWVENFSFAEDWDAAKGVAYKVLAWNVVGCNPKVALGKVGVGDFCYAASFHAADNFCMNHVL